jgi:hypothetical protein
MCLEDNRKKLQTTQVIPNLIVHLDSKDEGLLRNINGAIANLCSEFGNYNVVYLIFLKNHFKNKLVILKQSPKLLRSLAPIRKLLLQWLVVPSTIFQIMVGNQARLIVFRTQRKGSGFRGNP